MTDATNKPVSVNLQVRVPSYWIPLLDDMAKRDNVSVADMVRAWISSKVVEAEAEVDHEAEPQAQTQTVRDQVIHMAASQRGRFVRIVRTKTGLVSDVPASLFAVWLAFRSRNRKGRPIDKNLIDAIKSESEYSPTAHYEPGTSCHTLPNLLFEQLSLIGIKIEKPSYLFEDDLSFLDFNIPASTDPNPNILAIVDWWTVQIREFLSIFNQPGDLDRTGFDKPNTRFQIRGKE